MGVDQAGLTLRVETSKESALNKNDGRHEGGKPHIGAGHARSSYRLHRHSLLETLVDIVNARDRQSLFTLLLVV